jgi:hypothetical protein
MRDHDIWFHASDYFGYLGNFVQVEVDLVVVPTQEHQFVDPQYLGDAFRLALFEIPVLLKRHPRNGRVLFGRWLALLVMQPLHVVTLTICSDYAGDLVAPFGMESDRP